MTARKNDWADACQRYRWIELDGGRYLLDGSLSLKKFWYRYGGRWSKLKRLIREHRGDRCEKCGAEGVTLEAHEDWEHVSASSAGLDPKEIKECLQAHRDQRRKNDAAVERSYLAKGEPIPHWLKRRPRALVRALVEIRLLCENCHDDSEHSWISDHHRDFIMATYYSGLCELPDYKTYAEWEAAMQDEADLRNEDENLYSRP